jgi:hypothetical protein
MQRPLTHTTPEESRLASCLVSCVRSCRGDLWVMGAQNVGKSTLIRALQRLGARPNQLSPTVSDLPGTTLRLMEVPNVPLGGEANRRVRSVDARADGCSSHLGKALTLSLSLSLSLTHTHKHKHKILLSLNLPRPAAPSAGATTRPASSTPTA